MGMDMDGKFHIHGKPGVFGIFVCFYYMYTLYLVYTVQCPHFLAEVGQMISAVSGDDRESSFLFQRISVLIQRYNDILLHESFTEESRPMISGH